MRLGDSLPTRDKHIMHHTQPPYPQQIPRMRINPPNRHDKPNPESNKQNRTRPRPPPPVLNRAGQVVQLREGDE